MNKVYQSIIWGVVLVVSAANANANALPNIMAGKAGSLLGTSKMKVFRDDGVEPSPEPVKPIRMAKARVSIKKMSYVKNVVTGEFEQNEELVCNVDSDAPVFDNRIEDDSANPAIPSLIKCDSTLDGIGKVQVSVLALIDHINSDEDFIRGDLKVFLGAQFLSSEEKPDWVPDAYHLNANAFATRDLNLNSAVFMLANAMTVNEPRETFVTGIEFIDHQVIGDVQGKK